MARAVRPTRPTAAPTLIVAEMSGKDWNRVVLIGTPKVRGGTDQAMP